MRSVRELLRDYNFVNTPDGRRNTVRFMAGLLALAAGGFMVLFVAFGGMNSEDTTYQYGPQEGDPFEVYASFSNNQWYIGYPTALYEPENRDRYNEAAIDDKMEEWERSNGVKIVDKEPIYSEDEHDVLLGYHVELQSPLSIPRLNLS